MPLPARYRGWLLVGCSGDIEQEGAADALVASPVPQQVEMNARTVMLDDPVFRVGGTEASGPTAFGRVNGGSSTLKDVCGSQNVALMVRDTHDSAVQ